MPPSGTRRAFVLSNFLTLRSLIRSPAARIHDPPTQAIAQSARLALLALLTLLVLGGFAPPVWPQQPRIHYIYDDLGRLVGVVDQDGNAATYTYDAVGNILAIGRHSVADTPGPVAITLVAPSKGKVGTPVSIFGRGFNADAAQDVASFSGAIATVTAATTNTLTTSVPPEALTGPITVTTPLGIATSPEPFRVLGLLTVSPAGAVLVPNGTQQLTVLEGGSPTNDITWAVNGIHGGDATVGTISSGGLYTAPATVPSPPTVTVRATLLDDTTVSASAEVAILLPQPLFIAGPVVSIGFAVPSFDSVNSLVAPAVSVSFAVPTTVSPLVAPAVSVEMAPP
jgi:YD repeat-containing protein